MDKNFSTKEILDLISEDTRTYKAKIEAIKFEVAQKNFLQETEFMRDILAQQAGRKELLSNKTAETEALREKVRRKKFAMENEIKNFYKELKR